jgi:hypothetical protein
MSPGGNMKKRRSTWLKRRRGKWEEKTGKKKI